MDDPLAGITLEEEDYRWVTQEICAVAERVRLAAAAALPEAAPPSLPCFVFFDRSFALGAVVVFPCLFRLVSFQKGA